MTYLALGDSISIDDYTGVPGGGAASLLAKRLNADPFLDLTYDGAVASGVLAKLQDLLDDGMTRVDVATLTVGGNDLLGAAFFRQAGERSGLGTAMAEFDRTLRAILDGLQKVADNVVLSTIYDPTDGDDARAAELGLTPAARASFEMFNDLLRNEAKSRSLLLADLEALFRGHGMGSADPWLVLHIEPNAEEAEAIAAEWHRLLSA